MDQRLADMVDAACAEVRHPISHSPDVAALAQLLRRFGLRRSGYSAQIVDENLGAMYGSEVRSIQVTEVDVEEIIARLTEAAGPDVVPTWPLVGLASAAEDEYSLPLVISQLRELAGARTEQQDLYVQTLIGAVRNFHRDPRVVAALTPYVDKPGAIGEEAREILSQEDRERPQG
jgi:hypothetical protein